MLDRYRPGQLAPLQQAERDLARVRLTGSDAGPAAGAAFAGLRQHSTPDHLAHGLLDHAQHLINLGETEAAAAAIREARGIATRLRCQPLLDGGHHRARHAPHRGLVTTATITDP